MGVETRSATQVTETLAGKVQLEINPVDDLVNDFKSTRCEFGFLVEVVLKHLPGQVWPGPQFLCRIAGKWLRALGDVF